MAIIELVGLAGTGKSTLSKALAERTNNIRLEALPRLGQVKSIPFVLRHTFSILPILPGIYLHKNQRCSAWDHFKLTMLLYGWHERLHVKALENESVFVLDQGPVYMMAYETLFGTGRIQSEFSRRSWDHVFHRWAETLDMVIWLDTHLPVLTERIRKRETRHGVKSKSDADAYQYLASYRQAYEYVISRLTACSDKLKILSFDTGENSLDETLSKVITELSHVFPQVKPLQAN